MDSQKYLKLIAAILAAMALLLFIAAAVVSYPLLISQTERNDEQRQSVPLLSQVRQRGFVRCGIEGGLAGFSLIQGEAAFKEDGYTFFSDAQGFDADFCRAVTIAIFGTSEEHLFFTRAQADKRFEMVRTGAIDLLIRNTTWTANRDTLLGIDFGPIIYHDGQKFLAPVDSGIHTLAQLDGQSICALPSTTTVENVKTTLDELGLTYHLITERRPEESFKDSEDVIEAYLRQKCTVMTGDESQLLARHTELMNPEEHTLFPERAISYEPLAPVLIENDSQWHDIITYAILTTIYAEELGINSTNVSQYDQSSTLLYKQFLGIPDDSIEEYVGSALGIDQSFSRNIIQQVGNYKEIYERNLGQIITERGPNQIWKLHNDGKLYSPPWQSAVSLTSQTE